MPILIGQDTWRFRNNDGNEVTATWKALAGQNVVPAFGEIWRLRFVVGNGPAPFSDTVVCRFQIQWRKNLGPWFDIAVAPEDDPRPVIMSLCNLVDNGHTTKQLYPGPVPPTNFCQEESIGTTSANVTIPVSHGAEIEFGLTLREQNCHPGDLVEMRVVTIPHVDLVYNGFPAILFPAIAEPVKFTLVAPPVSLSGGLNLSVNPAVIALAAPVAAAAGSGQQDMTPAATPITLVAFTVDTTVTIPLQSVPFVLIAPGDVTVFGGTDLEDVGLEQGIMVGIVCGMAVDAVGIANMALTLLGEEPILSINEHSKPARFVCQHYENVRDFVLRQHCWSCATKRAQLALLVDAPAWGFAHQYQLPEDYLRLVEIENNKDPYHIEDGKIISDAGGMNIVYVFRLEDVRRMDTLLQQAIAAMLAAELAVPLTQNINLMRTLRVLFQQKLDEARQVDAVEGPIENVQVTDWADARGGPVRQ